MSNYWPGTNIPKSRNNAFTAHERGDTEINWATFGSNAAIARAATKTATKKPSTGHLARKKKGGAA